MKRKYIATLAAIALLPLAAFTQTPPTPPQPPVPPQPPAGPQDRHEKLPKVPVTFLGVDTSTIPSVLCDQMNLAKGFGLVVDYVSPDGPAAAAGVQQNDILKMFNDQILLEPSQLAKLVRSYPEGTTVTLTILRKGKEEKIPVKLGKKEVSQKLMRQGEFPFGDHDFGDLGNRMQDLTERMGNMDEGPIHDVVMRAQQEAQRVRDEAQRRRDEVQRVRDAAQRQRDEAIRVSQRAREEARRAAGQISVTRTGESGLQNTRIDIGKAQIVFSDDKGELRIENANGKKMLTAKDPKGMLQFSGPIEAKEELDKVPAEIRQRYENLQQRDLPSVISSEDEDDDDDSGDTDDDNGDENSSSIEQISFSPQTLSRNVWTFRTILI
jgi:serine protease Do